MLTLTKKKGNIGFLQGIFLTVIRGRVPPFHLHPIHPSVWHSMSFSLFWNAYCPCLANLGSLIWWSLVWWLSVCVCVWLGRTGSVHSCSGSVTVIGLGLAAGTESGRSSPYYNQLDARSSTPTTNQAPKHFHVPGRPGLNIHLIGCCHHFHIHPTVYLDIN